MKKQAAKHSAMSQCDSHFPSVIPKSLGKNFKNCGKLP